MTGRNADGRLTDSKGRTVSFKNTIVICTSNLGSGIIQDYLLKNPSLSEEKGQKEPQEKKGKVFTTYTVSPTGREIITLGKN